MLYLHYEDRVQALSQLIKMGTKYQEEAKQDQMNQDCCIICSGSFARNSGAFSFASDSATSRNRGGKFTLQCGHDNFHADCITRWLHEKPQCPLCKDEVDTYELGIGHEE